MPRTPARFNQADIARALRAMRDSGVPSKLVMRPDGNMEIVPQDRDIETPLPAVKEPEREIIL